MSASAKNCCQKAMNNVTDSFEKFGKKFETLFNEKYVVNVLGKLNLRGATNSMLLGQQNAAIKTIIVFSTFLTLGVGPALFFGALKGIQLIVNLAKKCCAKRSTGEFDHSAKSTRKTGSMVHGSTGRTYTDSSSTRTRGELHEHKTAPKPAGKPAAPSASHTSTSTGKRHTDRHDQKGPSDTSGPSYPSVSALSKRFTPGSSTTSSSTAQPASGSQVTTRPPVMRTATAGVSSTAASTTSHTASSLLTRTASAAVPSASRVSYTAPTSTSSSFGATAARGKQPATFRPVLPSLQTHESTGSQIEVTVVPSLSASSASGATSSAPSMFSAPSLGSHVPASTAAQSTSQPASASTSLAAQMSRAPSLSVQVPANTAAQLGSLPAFGLTDSSASLFRAPSFSSYVPASTAAQSTSFTAPKSSSDALTSPLSSNSETAAFAETADRTYMSSSAGAAAASSVDHGDTEQDGAFNLLKTLRTTGPTASTASATGFGRVPALNTYDLGDPFAQEMDSPSAPRRSLSGDLNDDVFNVPFPQTDATSSSATFGSPAGLQMGNTSANLSSSMMAPSLSHVPFDAQTHSSLFTSAAPTHSSSVSIDSTASANSQGSPGAQARSVFDLSHSAAPSTLMAPSHSSSVASLSSQPVDERIDSSLSSAAAPAAQSHSAFSANASIFGTASATPYNNPSDGTSGKSAFGVLSGSVTPKRSGSPVAAISAASSSFTASSSSAAMVSQPDTNVNAPTPPITRENSQSSLQPGASNENA